MNKTILIAAMLAVATVLAAGLTVLPASVQEAQANPCSNSLVEDNTDGDSTGGGGSSVTSEGDQDCTFIGYNEFDEN